LTHTLGEVRSSDSVPGVSLLAMALILRAGHLVLPSGRLPGRSGNSTNGKPPRAGAFRWWRWWESNMIY